jgi:hypothetical protein
VYGLSIRQQDYSQIPVIHFFNSSPSPYSTIRLYVLSFGKPDNLLNPFVSDHLPIRPDSNFPEVFRCLHCRFSCSASPLRQTAGRRVVRSTQTTLLQVGSGDGSGVIEVRMVFGSDGIKAFSDLSAIDNKVSHAEAVTGAPVANTQTLQHRRLKRSAFGFEMLGVVTEIPDDAVLLQSVEA